MASVGSWYIGMHSPPHIPRLTPHTERGNDRMRLQTEQPKPEVYLTAFSTIYWMLRTIRACVTQV